MHGVREVWKDLVEYRFQVAVSYHGRNTMSLAGRPPEYLHGKFVDPWDKVMIQRKCHRIHAIDGDGFEDLENMMSRPQYHKEQRNK